MRFGSWCLVHLSLFLLGATPASAVDVYTLDGDLAFEITIPGNGSVVRGTIYAVSPEELESWDLTTDGQDANALPGTHACSDLGFNPFASCPMVIEGIGDQAEALAFGLSLNATSGPVSQIGPSFSTFVDDAFGGTAYIISSDPGERVPVSSSGPSLNFTGLDLMDSSLYVQPGESTVWLMSRFELGEIGAALDEGATLFMMLRDNSAPGAAQTANTPEVHLVKHEVPEPALSPGSLLALSGLLLGSRALKGRRQRAAVPG